MTLTEKMAELQERMDHGSGKERLDALATGATLIGLLPRLVMALDNLANEAAGLRAFESSVRYVISNTNYSCIELRVDEARALLSEIDKRLSHGG